RDLVTLLGNPEGKITVTYPGVSKGLQPIPAEQCISTLTDLKLRPGYFLYVGNLKEFKNVPRLIDAYKHLKQHHPDVPPLVLVGRNFMPGFDTLLNETPGVRWLKEVEATQLPVIYSSALALVFPSLYEGFGLPPLEAMACGTPVICSDRGSLPEVVGDAALLV